MSESWTTEAWAVVGGAWDRHRETDRRRVADPAKPVSVPECLGHLRGSKLCHSPSYELSGWRATWDTACTTILALREAAPIHSLASLMAQAHAGWLFRVISIRMLHTVLQPHVHAQCSHRQVTWVEETQDAPAPTLLQQLTCRWSQRNSGCQSWWGPWRSAMFNCLI